MRVQVDAYSTMIVIRWWPDGHPWHEWSVTKMLDFDALEPTPAFFLGSSPSRYTAESGQEQIDALGRAVRISGQLDRCLKTRGSFQAVEVIQAPWQSEPASIAPKAGCNGWTEISIPTQED